ncbi:MAG TPA: hypothetical protein VLD61_04615 [Methylomirabilota bacterium]|nr:hypothetical protein [Methylomirabilota bacterium]
MLDQVIWIGLVVVLLGVLRVPGRPRGRQTVQGVKAVREAMQGREAAAVLAEFRRSGIQPPERRAAGWGFGLP